jgi:succinoglycan biosynthesis protein ExoO
MRKILNRHELMSADMQQPLVSVYIPSYKAEETLEKAVRSALAQMEDMEVIIVDDCSPDNGYAVAQKLAAEDSRVKVYRLEKNSGAPTAMNFAMREARGKWLASLDSDDWYEEGRLKKLISAAEAENVEMGVDNQYFFDKHANKVSRTAFADKGRKRILDLDVFLANSNATKHFDYGMLKPVFRTDFVRKHSVKYYESTRMGEDYYVLLSFFAAGGRAILIDEPLYSYVQPFGSISGKPQQDGRKHYNHQLQKATNQYFMDTLKGRISDKQMQQLKRRGQEIDSLIAYYKLRESIQQKDIKTIIATLPNVPLEFWKMMAAKVVAKLVHKKFHMENIFRI